MRGIVAAFAFCGVFASRADLQVPAQLPVGTTVRIELARHPDSLLVGTIQRSTESCTLVQFASDPTGSRPTVAVLRSISRLWVATGHPESPWQLYPIERLRAAEPSGC